MSGDGELYDSVKSIVAKLYVLRHSCAGIIHNEKNDKNLSWFKGVESTLKESLDELQKVLLALAEVPSIGEKEKEDWANVERLIKKLDNSTVTESLHS